jgi:hypothetical protein
VGKIGDSWIQSVQMSVAGVEGLDGAGRAHLTEHKSWEKAKGHWKEWEQTAHCF